MRRATMGLGNAMRVSGACGKPIDGMGITCESPMESTAMSGANTSTSRPVSCKYRTDK